jgi:ATP-binding cassette subfamily C protein CydD
VIRLPRREPSAAGRLLALEPRARPFLRAAVACGFVAGAFVVAAACVTAAVVDGVFRAGQGLADVLPLLALLVVLAAARSGLTWAAEVLAQRASSRLKGTLRGALTARLLALGPGFASGERSGELVSVLTGGLETLDVYVTSFQPARGLAVLVPLLVLIVALILDPLTALVLVVTGPMLVLFLVLIGGRARAITARRFLELRWMSAFFLDMLGGIATLKTFGRSEEQIENIEAVSRSYGDTTMEVLRTAFQTALVLEWGATVATALVAVEVSLRLMDGTLPFVRALAVLIITPEFFLPLRQLAIRFHAGAAGTAVAERMLAILEAPGAAPAGPATAGRAPAGPASAVPASPPEIRFHDVRYAYEDGRRPALRGLDLTIGSGRTVALVGETGAGKSTVASLLLRFIDADAGSVTVDGVPLAGIDPSAWRRSIAWVPQAPHLFSGSIADNIRLARPDATMGEVEAAARDAHAAAFIEALPGGYDTQVGEGGLRLSGGQRQRLAIARAFLRDAPFVILDEATSHLDPASEDAIADAVRRLARRRTVLVISHRLRLAADADEVVVLHAGRAVDAGPAARLLARDGPYSRLVAAAEDGLP